MISLMPARSPASLPRAVGVRDRVSLHHGDTAAMTRPVAHGAARPRLSSRAAMAPNAPPLVAGVHSQHLAGALHPFKPHSRASG